MKGRDTCKISVKIFCDKLRYFIDDLVGAVEGLDNTAHAALAREPRDYALMQ